MNHLKLQAQFQLCTKKEVFIFNQFIKFITTKKNDKSEKLEITINKLSES